MIEVTSPVLLVLIFCLATSARTEDNPVIFPESTDTPEKIPESVLIKMSSFSNVTEFLNFLIPPRSSPGATDTEFSPTAGTDKFGRPLTPDNDTSTSWGRKGLSASVAGTIATSAGCQVEMQAVEIDRPNDPAIVLWPMCTRVKRCGGCCSSSFLECVAIKSKEIAVNVLQARYLGSGSSGNFEVLGVKSFKLEEHEKCQCQCKEKAEQCTARQVYKKDECRCDCKDRKARDLCQGGNQIWDSKDCLCKCKNEDECSTGFFFSPRSCICEAIRVSRLGRIRARVPIAGAPISRDESDVQSGRHIGIRPSDDIGLYTMARSQSDPRTYLIPSDPQVPVVPSEEP